MRKQRTIEKDTGKTIPVVFIRDYQKPMEAGGRVIRKGTMAWVTPEYAERMIDDGFVKIFGDGDEEE